MSDDLPVLDRLKLELEQECKRMSKEGDFFVEISAQTDEVRAVALEVRDSLGQLGLMSFPKSTEIISVDPEQSDLLMWTSMSSIEQQYIVDIHKKFVAWLNTDLAPRIGLSMYPVPTKDGTMSVIPLRIDYDTFRSALMTSLTSVYLADLEKSGRGKISLLGVK